MGSGDRAVAIERLRRWVEHAVEHLSTEMIDQMALRVEMYLAMEARNRGEEERAREWYDRFHAELAEDKRAHRQVQ